jgi:dihydroxyacid dehydratase/phosphogluconate dehydratase
VSTGACVGHISPEAWAGGPIGKLRDGDTIRLRVDTRTLEGTVDVVSLSADALAARPVHPGLQPNPHVPADTRLWAALQNASGGSWSGCVYDAERIAQLLQLGMATEAAAKSPPRLPLA